MADIGGRVRRFGAASRLLDKGWGPWLLMLVLVVTAAVLSSIGSTRPLPTASIDGAYQSFNIVHTVAAGRSLVHDSPPYLGLGVAAAIVAASYPIGTTVGAVVAAAHMLSTACLLISAICLFRLLRFSLVEALTASALTLIVVLLTRLALRIAFHGDVGPLVEVGEPGNSLLSVRSVLPYLVGAILLGVSRKLDPSRHFLGYAAFVGMLAGLQIFWSNDFGIPSAAALTALYITATWRRLGWRSALSGACIVLAVGLATGGLFLLALTSGDPGVWLSYNFGGVARDQFWIFSPWQDSHDPALMTRLYTVRDLFAVLLPQVWDGWDVVYFLIRLIFIGALIATLTAMLRGPRRVEYEILTYIGATLLMAFYVADAGGHVSDRYSIPLLLFGALVGGAMAWRALPDQLRMRVAGMAGSMRKLARYDGAIWAIAAFLFVDLLFVGRVQIRATRSLPTTYVPELGGAIESSQMPSVALARALRAAAQHAGIGGSDMLFSSYYSFVDATAGTMPPTPYASIIHVLGNNAADRYLAGLETFNGLVTTINPAFSPWERYTLYEWWPRFRYIAENFTPVARSEQHIFWIRNPGGARRADGRHVSCSVQAKGGAAAQLEVPAIDPGDRDIYLLDVTLHYRVDFDPQFRLPVIGRRALVIGDLRATALGDRATTDSLGDDRWHFALPYAETVRSFPVEYRPDQAATVALFLDRLSGVSLTLQGCEAQLVGKSPLEGNAIPELTAADADGLAQRALDGVRPGEAKMGLKP